MSLVEPLKMSEPQIAEFCRRWHIEEFSLFGSALREDFSADSDVDVMAVFAPESRHSLFDLVTMEDELAAIFGRKVDFVVRRDIERSDNYIRRREILSSAKVVYAAR